MPKINPMALDAVVRCLQQYGKLTARDIIDLARTKHTGRKLKFLVIHQIKQMAIANPHLIGIDKTNANLPIRYYSKVKRIGD